MLNFQEFITEKTLSHAGYVVDKIFSKLKTLKGSRREGILSPEEIDVIKATKIGTVTADVSKWSRVNLKSNFYVTRKVAFNLTPYGEEREKSWRKSNA